MTQLLSEREVGGIPLLTVEMSEGEAEVILAALEHFLSHVDPISLESLTGAYPDEVTGLRNDLHDLLAHRVPLPAAESLKEPI